MKPIAGIASVRDVTRVLRHPIDNGASPSAERGTSARGSPRCAHTHAVKNALDSGRWNCRRFFDSPMLRPTRR